MKQRFSKKREAIYRCLCGTQTPPTADWVYQQLRPDFPDLSLGTVYRNLAQLKDAGLIQSLGVVNGQERFDGNVSPHTHFVCTQCGAVLDLMELTLPPSLLAQAQAASGCLIHGASLRLTGICPGCRKTLS